MNKNLRSHPPKSAVLVVGHFLIQVAGQVGGFAAVSWKKIKEIYDGDYLRYDQQSKRGKRREHSSKARPFESLSGFEPLLYPIKLDDEGDAGSENFKDRKSVV